MGSFEGSGLWVVEKSEDPNVKKENELLEVSRIVNSTILVKCDVGDMLDWEERDVKQSNVKAATKEGRS